MTWQWQAFQVNRNAAGSSDGLIQNGHTGDPNTSKLCLAYHIIYNGCLIYWSAKFWTEVALKSIKAEDSWLSQSLRTTICLMRLFRELKKGVNSFKAPSPIAKCMAFEGNSGAVELAKALKLRPQTKRINVKIPSFSRTSRTKARYK